MEPLRRQRDGAGRRLWHPKTTWRAALAIVRGFGLPTDAALRLLVDEYNPRCQPAWSLKELRHKVASAAASRVAPHWLAASPGKGLASGGDDPWAGSIRVRVVRAVPEPLSARPWANQGPETRVRLEVATADGKVLPRQYVVVPLHGHEGARTVYDAVLGDLAPEVWETPEAWPLAKQLIGRELEIVLPPGAKRATRMRRAP